MHAKRYVQDHPEAFPEIDGLRGKALESALRKTITRDYVDRYVKDKTNDAEQRRCLLNAWNKEQNKGQQISIPKEFVKKGGKPVKDKERLEREASPEVEKGYDYLAELKKPVKKMTIETQDGSTVVPIFSDFTTCGKLVRAYGHKFKESGKILGAQFAYQPPGDERAFLFDAPQGNDLVFVPLKQEDEDEGTFARKGKIFDWSKQAKKLELEFPTPQEQKEIKQQIINTLENKLVPESDLLIETAGAMLCDTKTSITGYLHYLQELKDSKETKPTKLFSSKPEDKPVWAPSVVGGRKLPGEKKLEGGDGGE